MILENANLKAKWEIALGSFDNEDQLIGELIAVPVLNACKEYLKAWEEDRGRLANATEALRKAEEQAIQVEMKNLISGDLLAKLKSRDKDTQYAAIEELKAKEITAELTGGLYVFSYRGVKMDSNDSAKLQDVGKYFATDVNPKRYDECWERIKKAKSSGNDIMPKQFADILFTPFNVVAMKNVNVRETQRLALIQVHDLLYRDEPEALFKNGLKFRDEFRDCIAIMKLEHENLTEGASSNGQKIFT